jgi:hypothetical protein
LRIIAQDGRSGEQKKKTGATEKQQSADGSINKDAENTAD